MKIGRIYSVIVIAIMGLILCMTAFGTSRLHIEKVQNIPYGKTVKISVDFQTATTIGSKVQSVNWRFKVIGNQKFITVSKENNKTLSVTNNNPSPDNRGVKVEIIDENNQTADILSIRLSPQMFYNYIVTASKGIGKNKHIWSIVDPSYKQSVSLKDSIIQSLYISFISLLDAHQKAPGKIRLSEEFLNNFGKSIDDLNALSIAEKKQRIISMFQLIGVNQDQINFENMLKLLDYFTLSHLVFTFPGISESLLKSHPEEGISITKYQKTDWENRAAPNRLYFGAITNNGQLLRVVLVQPKDSESGLRILQNSIAGFGITDASPLSPMEKSQQHKAAINNEVYDREQIKLAAVKSQGDLTEPKTDSTITSPSQLVANRSSIVSNESAASQQYTDSKSITAAKTLSGRQRAVAA